MTGGPLRSVNVMQCSLLSSSLLFSSLRPILNNFLYFFLFVSLFVSVSAIEPIQLLLTDSVCICSFGTHLVELTGLKLSHTSTRTDTHQHPKPALTPAVAIHLLVADTTDAAAQRHQPVPVSATVQFGCVPLFCILHTRTPHFHQRRGIRVRHRVREGCQVPYS